MVWNLNKRRRRRKAAIPGIIHAGGIVQDFVALDKVKFKAPKWLYV